MFRIRRRSRQTSPIAYLDLQEVLDALPVAVVLLDAAGNEIYSSPTSVALAKSVVVQHGMSVLTTLRERLGRIARAETTFPATHVSEAADGSHHAVTDFTVNRIGDRGFALTWRDITAERQTSRVAQSVADELTTAAAHFAELGERLVDGADQVSQLAETSAAGTEEMSASIREIAATAAAAAGNTATAVAAADQARQRLAKLAESSVRIGDVSTLITGIAQQTNLLALNATIEAARAGTAGRGFAVVAGEVKELAGRTATATAEITASIEQIQGDSTDVTEAIADIVRLIGEIENQQGTVAIAVDAQTATSNEMSSGISAVAGAATMSAEAAQELREAASFVTAKAEQLRTYVTR